MRRPARHLLHRHGPVEGEARGRRRIRSCARMRGSVAMRCASRRSRASPDSCWRSRRATALAGTEPVTRLRGPGRGRNPTTYCRLRRPADAGGTAPGQRIVTGIPACCYGGNGGYGDTTRLGGLRVRTTEGRFGGTLRRRTRGPVRSSSSSAAGSRGTGTARGHALEGRAPTRRAVEADLLLRAPR